MPKKPTITYLFLYFLRCYLFQAGKFLPTNNNNNNNKCKQCTATSRFKLSKPIRSV